MLAPLIRVIASSPGLTYSDDAASRFVNWLLSTPHCLNKAQEHDGRGQPLISYRNVTTRRPVPFTTCISIAAHFKIGLDTFLTGGTLEWNQSVYPDEHWSLPVLPVGFVATASLTPNELSVRIETLQEGIDPTRALSLSQTAATLGIDPLDIVCLKPKMAREIHSADVIRGIRQRQHEDSCRALELYDRSGRESSNNTRVRVKARLERDFPDLTPSEIEFVTDKAIAEIWTEHFSVA